MRTSSKSPAAVPAQGTGGLVHIERTFKVITPVHGGGVGWDPAEQAKHVRPIDPVTPVRSAAVRGQLRFWWRATTGCSFSSLQEMYDREAVVWGRSASEDKSGAGATALRVVRQPKTEVTSDLVRVAYGAFALMNGFKNDQEPRGILTLLKGPSELVLTTTPDFRSEVELAVDAWLAFGGIGGRTRRGFGAVHSANLDVQSRLRDRLAKQRLVPSLIGAKVDHGSTAFDDAMRAHENALESLKAFRQGVGIGRNAGQERNRPGRSRWPEADQIRRVRMANEPRHAPAHSVKKFPRAAFGMPIIFHFKDRGDPADNSLQPEGYERMASPLILRPMLHEGKWHAAAIVLNVPGLTDEIKTVSLRQAKQDVSVQTSLNSEELDLIGPVQQRSGNTILERFASFFAAR